MPTSPSVVPQNEPSPEPDDFYAWVNRQAALLRAGRLEELDLERIAGELDDVGNEIYERLESALTVLFMHMLKWDFQPERRSRSWEATIREQRRRVAKLLRENPSLKAKLDDAKEAAYGYGRDRVANGRLRVTADGPVSIELGPSSTLFRAGDVLRLVIAGRPLDPSNPLFGHFPALYEPSPRGRFGVQLPATLTIPLIGGADVTGHTVMSPIR